jgi:hypothetical protein
MGTHMRQRWLAGAAAVLALMLVGAQAAGASPAYRLTQRQGSESIVTQIGAVGARILTTGQLCANCRRTKFSNVTISYRRGRVLLVDPRHRTYAVGSISSLLRQARVEQARTAQPPRIPGLGVLAQPPGATVRTVGRGRIAGLGAVGYQVSEGSLVQRLWFALALPAPPSRFRALFGGASGLAAAAINRALGHRADALLLRAEVLTTGHWRRVLDTIRAQRARPPALSLVPPRNYKRGQLPGLSAHTSNVPARLNNLGIGPISRRPEIWAVYWGSFFQGSPATVEALNTDLAQMISDSDGYLAGLAQYGVGAGTFGGFQTVHDNPPRTVGGADFFSVEEMLYGMLSGNAPHSWGRFSSTDPIIVIFVPQSEVEQSGWTGYHFEIPTVEGALPWNHPAVPWAIVKVPDTPTVNLDATMEAASHEIVEAATDPFPFFTWVDPAKEPIWQDGEASDICSEGITSPWGPYTRLNGVAYSTYWSNSANACVPESRPSVQILYPGTGSHSACGQVMLRATATDPLDGPIPDTDGRGNPLYSWSDNGNGGFAHGMSTNVTLSPGVHTLTVTVGPDSQGLFRTSAPVTVTVTPPTPTVSISSPSPGSVWGTDQAVPFSGSASDVCDGTLSGASLVWREGSAVLGTGGTITHQFSTQGSHTVTLTATSGAGQPAMTSVTFTVGPPSGNPSPSIAQPQNNQAESDPTFDWTFSGQASDPHDGALSGNALQWYDTYTDSSGQVHSMVPLGSGTYFMHQLYWDGFQPTQNVITLVATDSLGHSAPTSVTVIVGAYS